MLNAAMVSGVVLGVHANRTVTDRLEPGGASASTAETFQCGVCLPPFAAMVTAPLVSWEYVKLKHAPDVPEHVSDTLVMLFVRK